jgi:hypothetical protein
MHLKIAIVATVEATGLQQPVGSQRPLLVAFGLEWDTPRPAMVGVAEAAQFEWSGTMRMESVALIGIAVAALLFSLARIADSRIVGAGDVAAPRYSIQSTSIDANGRSLLWVMNLSDGRVKVCGIKWGDLVPTCTPEQQ